MNTAWQDEPDRIGFYWVSRVMGPGPGRHTTVAEVYLGPRGVLYAQVIGLDGPPRALDWFGCWKGVRWLRIEEPGGDPVGG